MSKLTKYAKLIMVEVNDKPKEGKAAQSNKFYEMLYPGSGDSFTVNYGRVESTSTTMSYPLRKWDSLYNAKVKKGYKDVTSLVSTKVIATPNNEVLDDGLAGKFLQRMLDYSRNLVQASYTVSSATQEQIDEAQGLINQLSSVTDTKKINELLIRLYTVIPRKMNNVRDWLHPKINLLTFIEDEQDKLDAMSITSKASAPVKTTKKVLMSEKLGIKISDGVFSPCDQYIADQLKGTRYTTLDVSIPKEDERFSQYMKQYKDQSTRCLIHGTRCSNVISILGTGLQIRPSNCAATSGKAYGPGNYFSELTTKSLGYTGYDKDRILLIYEVFTGKHYTYEGWYTGDKGVPLTYSGLRSKGYNSTFVKPGNGLLNSEIIVYNESQQRLKKIIWMH